VRELTEAYVRGTAGAWERMVGPVSGGEVVSGRGAEAGYDVSVVIDLAGLGSRVGPAALVLSFPADVARGAVGAVLGADAAPELDADVADGIGEIANIVAGAAKPELAALGIDGCDVSLPTVVLGAQHHVFRRRDARCCAVRFRSGVGPFLLQLLSLRTRAGVARRVPGREGGVG